MLDDYHDDLIQINQELAAYDDEMDEDPISRN